MATISYTGFGKGPVVILSDADRLLLSEAVAQKQQQHGLTGKQLADQAGVNRTYFYALVSGNQVDLLRFAHIQKVLGVRLLDSAQIDEYLAVVRKLLTE
jgi:transcriptional regulator with XRE-family HTH domain